MFDVEQFYLSKKLHLTAMFCNNFYAIASFNCLVWKAKFILHFSDQYAFPVKVTDVRYCSCFVLMSSFNKVINNNKMEPKKKEKLYTSLAEQQQLLENFYNDLDDETYKNMSWT